MRTVLILNPTSGSSALSANQSPLEENEAIILAALRAYGIEPEVQYTTPEDTGSGLAKQAAESGADIVIAAGGDGTMHAVAQGLINTQSALGIIALGTMNNVAHSLEIPEKIEGACAVIATGTSRQIDVGSINGHIFLEVAGIGLEAALFPAAEEFKSSGWVSTVKSAVDGLKALLTFKSPRFTVSFDARRTRSYRAVEISICNSPYYGAHFRFAPNAVMDDGFLDVLIYKNFSKLQFLHHAISISRGKRALEARVIQRKIKSLRVRSQNPVEIHADGVLKGFTPATITVLPGALRVRIAEKLVHSAHMKSPEQKETQFYQNAQHATIIEEKGPLHVN